jgi:hypothetical protein
MLFLTSRELDLLIDLRTNWGRLYLREVARLLSEDASDVVDQFRNGRAFHSSNTTGDNVVAI